MRTPILALVAALGILFPAQAALVGPASAQHLEPTQEQRDERRVTFAVEGMSCGHCATSLAEGLRHVEGVLEASVTFNERRALVRYDAQRVTVQGLITAIEDLGYRAELDSEG